MGFIIAIGSVLYAAWDAGNQDKAFLRERDVERLEESGQASDEDLPSSLVRIFSRIK